MPNVTTSYADLIKEAFISPIRNVTVIDDEYPTLLSLIESGREGADIYQEKKIDSANIDRLKNIIEMCHSRYRWSIDVFDGKTPAFGAQDSVPPHIHHSDLIVLDYHLDGNGPEDDGIRARNIIQSLDQNNHYNLTLVHTKGYSDNLEKVFTDILTDFIAIDSSHPLWPEAEIVEKMNEWLDDNEDGEGHSWITNNISLLSIFKVCISTTPARLMAPRNPACPLHDFASEIQLFSRTTGLRETDIVRWKLADQLKHYDIQPKAGTRSDLAWYWDENTNYISTGKTFISVIRKSAAAPDEELIGSLSEALIHYNASPMQLLMAKMRYELDERGIGQASEIISNRYAQAGWLYHLLQNGQSDFAHDKAVNLHWEQLANASRNELRSFSKRILEAAKVMFPSEEKKFVEHFFRECISKKELSLGHLNAYSCSMSVRNNHLVTGTIIKIEGEMWVCLTPACDLVPGQKNSQWQSRIGDDYLVFRAVRFIPVKLNTANENANLNDYIYLNIDGTPSAFWIGSDNPHWDTFYAADLGRFTDENSLRLFSPRIHNQESGPVLKMKPLDANAVSELRYEYALNLLHKFGVSQTRVGLDFMDQNSMWV
ncbi:response regulator receiver domain [Pantoea dispersa]|uniref:response regulator receiver domain n=1 Tax=Pantoea dispersa TaxID=59814 RepID=UPI0028DF4E0A|nr:response regulator receiver domain [Pantoea dispersa]MDT8851691.1 response regulator receiver domain [Pantoea dispersa]